MKIFIRKTINSSLIKLTKMKFTFSVDSLSPLIEISELKTLLNKKLDNVKILDCTWFPHEENQKGESYFNQAKIASSQFFDINEIVDKSSKIQNSITTKDFFCEKMKEMDLRIDDIIICYDQKGIFSSPRVWFNFKIFGAKNVFVLNGGFKNCEQENIEIERLNQSSSPYRLTPPNSLSYNYKKDDYRVCNLERIFEISEGICRRKEKKNIIDLRKIEEEESNNQTEVTKEKYETEELDEKEIFENFEQAQIKEKEIKEQSFPQNMKWNSRRQIAGSESISYTKFVKSDSTFKSKKELSELFDDLDIDINKETTFYCDYGVTACIGILAFEILGKKANLYDGSWAEYGKIGDNEYFKRYRDQVSKISPNELTDQYFDSLPNEQRCKIEMQRMMIAKTKQMDKIKREMTDKEERKKNDDYEICDKLY